MHQHFKNAQAINGARHDARNITPSVHVDGWYQENEDECGSKRNVCANDCVVATNQFLHDLLHVRHVDANDVHHYANADACVPLRCECVRENDFQSNAGIRQFP